MPLGGKKIQHNVHTAKEMISTISSDRADHLLWRIKSRLPVLPSLLQVIRTESTPFLSLDQGLHLLPWDFILIKHNSTHYTVTQDVACVDVAKM